jgi:hypothetical protein
MTKYANILNDRAACKNTCMHTRTCTNTCMHECIQTLQHNTRPYRDTKCKTYHIISHSIRMHHTNTHECIHAYTRTSIDVCEDNTQGRFVQITHIIVHACIHLFCACMCMQTYIHTGIRKDIHTHIHGDVNMHAHVPAHRHMHRLYHTKLHKIDTDNQHSVTCTRIHCPQCVYSIKFQHVC